MLMCLKREIAQCGSEEAQEARLRYVEDVVYSMTHLHDPSARRDVAARHRTYHGVLAWAHEQILRLRRRCRERVIEAAATLHPGPRRW